MYVCLLVSLLMLSSLLTQLLQLAAQLLGQHCLPAVSTPPATVLEWPPNPQPEELPPPSGAMPESRSLMYLTLYSSSKLSKLQSRGHAVPKHKIFYKK